MRGLKVVGLGDLVEDTPPEHDPRALKAIHCWNFCGGWRPDLLPYYAAIYGLTDWEEMVELLITIRDRPSGK